MNFISDILNPEKVEWLISSIGSDELVEMCWFGSKLDF